MGVLGLKPIKLLPARERVASALRKAIIGRQIQEGETLTLESTAQELGVSITPVREAFRILERDGLISLEQNKAAVVLGVNEKTIREHYQIRATLESEACRLCCENGGDLTPVRECLEASIDALEAKDSGNYANFNQSFHNEKMEKMLMELWNGLSMGVKTTESEYAVKSTEEHKRILAAMEKRDGKLAAEEMRSHIYRSMQDVLTRYV